VRHRTEYRSAFLGLGGNIGDVPQAMRQALAQLASHPKLHIGDVSPLYKTPPWGIEDQPWFHNCCARVETRLQPAELLALCLKAERQLKRERALRWGPRTIDIDILDFDGFQSVSESLTVPHPRMFERAFVMRPLADLAPQRVIVGKTVAEWNSCLDDAGIEVADDAENWWHHAG
jgi:2-amino-4-hydroxy-6-hydroxymethyldihydropteridine diphosphokinase